MLSPSYEDLKFLLLVVFINILIILLFEFTLRYIKKFKKRNESDFEPHLDKYYTLLFEVYNAVEKCWLSEEYIEKAKRLINFNPTVINVPLMPHGYTPFLRACLNGCTELVLYMLSRGADVFKCSIYGDNPFYLATYAIATGKISCFYILEVLMQKGCSVNSKRYNGYVALDLAAYFKHNQLFWWLLVHGADPRIQELKPLRYHLNKKLLCIKNTKETDEKKIENTPI